MQDTFLSPLYARYRTVYRIGLDNRENPVIAHILDKGREDNDSTLSSKKYECCSNNKFLSEIFILLRVDDQW